MKVYIYMKKNKSRNAFEINENEKGKKNVGIIIKKTTYI